MRKTRILSIIIALSATTAQAQDVNNAYRFSNLSPQGTARSMGFGGALGSVGGDFSSISVNPAGLGIYRSSEFTFTPSVRVNSTDAAYLGTSTSDNNARLTISNLGLVLTSAKKGRRYENSAWKSTSFAIGVNRLADFNNNYSYKGTNKTSSASQAMEADANQYPDDVPSNNIAPGYIGYQSYLLNQDNNGKYYTTVPYTQGIQQMRTVQETGGINELALSFGGNYKEKLMLGFTVGIPIINYARHSQYSETYSGSMDSAVNPGQFSSFRLNDNYSTAGTGINLKIGAIYKATNYLRFGLALHSPTFYRLTDNYTQTITTNVSGFNNQLSSFDEQPYSIDGQRMTYSLTTPWKAVLSGTFLFKQYGFISVDYEYVGYNMMHFGLPDDASTYVFNSLSPQSIDYNQTIKNTYKGASNLRIGAEGVLGKFFMLRAGFGYYGSPYKNSPVNSQRIDISGGIGFHFNHFFTDLAYVHRMYQGQEQPYSIDPTYIVSYEPVGTTPTAKFDYSMNTIAWTVGVKFGSNSNANRHQRMMQKERQQEQAPADSGQAE